MKQVKKQVVNNLKDQLINEMIDIFSWNVDYYLTEPESEIYGYDTFKIVDKVNMKILIPEGIGESINKDISIIQIPIKEFVSNKEPRQGDMIFFKEFLKFYSVDKFEKYADLFRVELKPYKNCI